VADPTAYSGRGLVGSLPVAFYTPYNRSGLPVVPNLTAEEPTLRIDRAGKGRETCNSPDTFCLGEIIAARAVAAVDADVEAGPARHRQGGRGRIRRSDCLVRRLRRTAKQCQRNSY